MADVAYPADTLLWDEDGEQVWVHRRLTEAQACDLVMREVGLDHEEVHLTPVLMREMSEVEKRIAGHEGEMWKVECTKRAKASEPYWRLEI